MRHRRPWICDRWKSISLRRQVQVRGPLAIQAKLSRNVVWGIDLTRLVAREVRDGLEVVGLTVQTLQN